MYVRRNRIGVRKENLDGLLVPSVRASVHVSARYRTLLETKCSTRRTHAYIHICISI